MKMMNTNLGSRARDLVKMILLKFSLSNLFQILVVNLKLSWSCWVSSVQWHNSHGTLDYKILKQSNIFANHNTDIFPTFVLNIFSDWKLKFRGPGRNQVFSMFPVKRRVDSFWWNLELFSSLHQQLKLTGADWQLLETVPTTIFCNVWLLSLVTDGWKLYFLNR